MLGVSCAGALGHRGNLSPIAECRLFRFSHFWPLPFVSRLMREATSIAVSLPVLCELVWVWPRLFGFAMVDIAASIRSLLLAGLFGLLVQRWKLA